MSETLARVREISHLPIFPLPMVMLPNESVPLHIFEDRYRKMLVDVQREHNLFGITFFDPDDQLSDRPPAGSVGCVAEIKESEALPDGRSNIVTLGLVRYRLIAYIDAGEPYMVAEVDYFEDDQEGSTTVEALADEVYTLFERMAKAAFRMGGHRGPFPEIQRTDPESLSFLVTAAFNFDNDKKYRLLESTSTRERLDELRSVLNQAVAKVEESADIQSVARLNGHGKKKIDL